MHLASFASYSTRKIYIRRILVLTQSEKYVILGYLILSQRICRIFSNIKSKQHKNKSLSLNREKTHAKPKQTQNTSSAVAEMGDRGHNRHGMKRGGGAAVPISRGELGPRLTQCGLGRGLLPYKVASSSIQPFCHNRHGLKTGGLCPL